MQETIAVIFDFDDTLAPDSTSSFLDALGVDVPRFWQEQVGPLIEDGWDPVPAYLHQMIQLSAANGPIRREDFVRWAKRIKPFVGATRIFDRVRRHAHGIYLVSSGIGDILRHTRLARYFQDIWACDFHYGGDGNIAFPRNIVSFTDKTRFLFQIAKGITGPEWRGQPFAVNRKIEPAQLRVPFDQMIVVGDGLTDIPCFSLVRNSGGYAIGVFDRANKDKWGRAWGFIEDGRVSNLVPADFSKNSALSLSLMMAVENLARRLRLRAQTYQG
jgi:hypothetical protein